MAKNKARYSCQNCGFISLQWLGRCPECDAWNTFVEEIAPSDKEDKACARAERSSDKKAEALVLSDIKPLAEGRSSSGFSELDNVLGGGFVAGSVVLVGGEPGIGKSTLLLQTANVVSKNLAKTGKKCLYVAGEESAQQVRLRSQRLNADSAGLLVLPETDLETVCDKIKEIKPALVVIDSIQTVASAELSSPAGSAAQVRSCAQVLIDLAKETDTPMAIIGHLTKEGVIAGPKLLEHMVDTVIYFEGDDQQTYRLIRATKNRFGSTNEIGVFEMGEHGLAEVTNPSSLFLSQHKETVPGAVVTAAMEGKRPLLLEIQALVSPTAIAVPRRTFSGLDYNRSAIIIATLEKKAKYPLGTHDIFLNLVGGLKVAEPAVDLAIALAVASSFKNKALPPKTVVFGEVGLTGEIRQVAHQDARIAEAARQGFAQAVFPVSSKTRQAAKDLPGPIKLTPISSLQEALHILA